MVAARSLVDRQCQQCSLSDRYDPVSSPLTGNLQKTLLVLDICASKRDQLRDSDPRGVQGLQHCAISQRSRIIALNSTDQANRLIDTERIRISSAHSGGRQSFRGVGGEESLLKKVIVESAQGGQVAGDGGRTQSGLVERLHQGRRMFCRQVCETSGTRLGGGGQITHKITAVGIESTLADLLKLQVGEKSLQRAVQFWRKSGGLAFGANAAPRFGHGCRRRRFPRVGAELSSSEGPQNSRSAHP